MTGDDHVLEIDKWWKIWRGRGGINGEFPLGRAKVTDEDLWTSGLGTVIGRKEKPASRAPGVVYWRLGMWSSLLCYCQEVGRPQMKSCDHRVTRILFLIEYGFHRAAWEGSINWNYEMLTLEGPGRIRKKFGGNLKGRGVLWGWWIKKYRRYRREKRGI